MSQSPPSLGNQAVEASNPSLQARVQMAMCSAAQDLGASAPTTPDEQMRTNLATRVANNPQMFVMPFTDMVCAKGITSQSTDAEISTMVAAVWNTMAGHPAVPLQ